MLLAREGSVHMACNPGTAQNFKLLSKGLQGGLLWPVFLVCKPHWLDTSNSNRTPLHAAHSCTRASNLIRTATDLHLLLCLPCACVRLCISSVVCACAGTWWHQTPTSIKSLSSLGWTQHSLSPSPPCVTRCSMMQPEQAACAVAVFARVERCSACTAGSNCNSSCRRGLLLYFVQLCNLTV